jgi:Mce-associated membrane protein
VPATEEEPGSLASAERPLAGRTVLIDAPKNGWQDPPEPSPETFEEEGDAPEVRATPGRRGLLTVLLGVLLVAGLAAAAVLGWQSWNARRTETARTEALAAAQKAAPIVLSYDYRRLNKDFAAARAHLTGDFRDEYGKTTKTVVGPTAEKYRGVVKATVAAPATGGTPAASVVSASPDKVVVLLFVNQVTESTQVSGARVDLNRVRMTMKHTDDGWKVSAVDAL